MLLNYSEYPTVYIFKALKTKSISNFNIILTIIYYLCATESCGRICDWDIGLQSVCEDHPISNKTSSNEENVVHYKTPISFSNIWVQSFSFLIFHIHLNLRFRCNSFVF